jgi:YggT family protein
MIPGCTGDSSFCFDFAVALRHTARYFTLFFRSTLMVLLANILLALAKLVELASGLLTIYKYILLASVVVSWVNADPYNPLVNFIYRVTDPVLRRIRRHMPDTGMLDLSPLVAFAAIYVLQIIAFDTAYHYLTSTSMSLKMGL